MCMEKDIKHKHPLLDSVYDTLGQYITATLNKYKQLMTPKTLNGQSHIVWICNTLSFVYFNSNNFYAEILITGLDYLECSHSL